MIPLKIARFLEERASLGFAGTRDGNLVPRGHRVSGWQVGPGGQTLLAFIPAVSADVMVAALVDNGRIAVTLEELGTHETYQVKGRYVSHRPILPSERDIVARIRERLARAVRTFFVDEQLTAAMDASIPSPSLAVEIAVDEVFVQTPGPGAGARVAPEAQTR